MTQPDQQLRRALTEFLADAAKISWIGPPGSARQLADQLAAMPSARVADTIAAEAAAVNGYVVPDPTRPHRPGRPWLPGRRLSADNLTRFGLPYLVAGGHFRPTEEPTDALAGFLAGPPVQMWRYLMLDADVDETVTAAVAGWEMLTPGPELLTAISDNGARVGAHANTLLPAMYGGEVFLRRTEEGSPPTGFLFGALLENRPYLKHWPVLLVMNLWSNHPCHAVAQHLIEPGRRVDTLYDHTYFDIVGEDGDVEIPHQGFVTVTAEQAPRFSRFADAVSALITRAGPRHGHQTQSGYARLTNSAAQFLTATEQSVIDATTVADHDDVTLRYVVALEGLLTGGEGPGELTRKVTQRAAVLIGNDDDDRLRVEQVVKDAYAARSHYAHGATVTKRVALDELRDVVRRVLLAQLILGDPLISGLALSTAADRALLSVQVREDQVADPQRAFWDTVADNY